MSDSLISDIHKHINTMFYLRRIAGTGQETNSKLGSIYTLIKPDDPEFKKLEVDLMTHEDVGAFIIAPETDNQVICLDMGETAYIMTETGKTFANVTPANLINL